jgi:hypothetical protein
VADQWIAFEQTERVLNRIDERPVELEQLTSGATRKDDTCHRLLWRATGIELSAKIRQCDGLIARELPKTGLDRGERLRVGQDLRRLLQGVVLVDRHQRSCWFSITGNQYVITTIGDVAQKGTEIGSELAGRDCLCHSRSVPHCVRARERGPTVRSLVAPRYWSRRIVAVQPREDFLPYLQAASRARPKPGASGVPKGQQLRNRVD